ncbi:unnamed protein product [Rotaria socialis]|nr:unnamed protein product [Rotaria socialis]CAF3286133.1 unnamed protein product [Rotaria socialis]CAF3385851.1 unnamed protein product [Rotaria socialis]CAF3481300.1 unnamed protein product [Rotaria socialis]CAF3524046.1 unnamed protein product [Rotaria socialis]
MSSAQKDTKKLQSATPTNVHITGGDTPDSDPRSKANQENEGRLSGSQFTITETPAFYINQTSRTNK